MKKNLVALAVFALVLGGLFSVFREPLTNAIGQLFPSLGLTPDPSAANDSSDNNPPVTIAEDPDLKAVEDYGKQVRALRKQRNFDALDALADEARSSQFCYGNGSWKIAQFYLQQGFNSELPQSACTEIEQTLAQWVAAKPKSLAARIAQAEFYTDYAWYARGGGYSDTVTDEGWKLFAERLAKAREILEEAKSLTPQDPMWWRAMMTVALGQGWTHAQYNALFEEAKAFAPKFWGYDVARATYLMPRWYGVAGEMEAATETETARPGGLGMEIYARVIYDQHWRYDNIFTETQASWEKTKEGYAMMLQRYPDSLSLWSGYGCLASYAKDRPTARKICDKLAGRCLVSEWASVGNFRQFQRWAYGG